MLQISIWRFYRGVVDRGWVQRRQNEKNSLLRTKWAFQSRIYIFSSSWLFSPSLPPLASGSLWLSCSTNIYSKKKIDEYMLIRLVMINRCIVTSLKRVKAAWLSLGTRLPAMWCDRIFDNFVVFVFFPLRTMHWKLIITTGDALAPRDEALLCETWHRATGCRGDRTHQVGGRYWWSWQKYLWGV